ncbi:MAG: SDR family NAD(P)-dependent oxidoreductase [Acidimicrobiales bacterium]
MSGTVVVTGGGSGIGEAIARAAHADGWTVGVLDRDAEAAARVASSLGSRAVALAADTASEAEVEAALDQLAAATGEAAPHGVVANAGIVRFGPLAELPVDDWRRGRREPDGHVRGPAGGGARMLAAGTAGSLVAVTSMNGVVPGPGAGAYGATKAGIALLVQQMAVEWGPSGIRANAVAPGLVDGGMSGPIYADAEVRRLREARVPLGRLGTPDDVAGAVLFLLSDAAAYVSGTELLVDGAVTPSLIAGLPRPAGLDRPPAEDPP